MKFDDLPFINGIPDIGQNRLQWIQNGEHITGADTKFGSDGVINRVSSQLQQNIDVIHGNTKQIYSAVEQNILDISAIQVALDITANTDIIKTVSEHTTNISDLKFGQDKLNTTLTSTALLISNISKDLGIRNALDTVSNPIHDDIYWLKNELGNYTGQDINGLISDNPASGIKGRLTSIASTVSDHEKRLIDLQDKWKDSDVGGLTNLINQIRIELGTSTNTKPVFDRLSDLDIFKSNTDTTIESIKKAINLDNANSLAQRVTTNEINIAKLDSDINDSSLGIKANLSSLQNVINSRGGLSDQVNQNNTNINTLTTTVGISTSDGLQGQVARIIEKTGITPDGTNPPLNSIAGNLSRLESLHSGLSISFNDLQVEVGTENSGIKGDIKELKSGQYGYGTDLRFKGAIGDGKADGDEVILKTALDSGITVFNGGTYKVTDVTILHKLKDTRGTAKVAYNGNIYPFGNIVNQYITLKVPTDFYNISHALEWLSNKRIVGDSGADITVADGTYEQSWVNNLNHLDGTKISIRGNETDRSKVVINMNNLENRDCFTISNGYHLGWLNGFTIVGKNGWLAKGSWADQSFGAGVRAFDGGTVNCGTEIHVDKMYYGFRAMHGATIKAIGTSAPNVKGGGVLVTNAGDVGIHAHTATIYCNNAEVYDAGDNAHGLGFGFCAEAGGYIVCEYAKADNNIKAGFYALSNGTAWAHGVSASGNMHGVLAWGGTVECNSLGEWTTELNGNTESGITATYRGFVGANKATVSGNKNGVVSTEGSTVDATGVVSTKNTANGFLSIDNGYITGYDMQSTNNTLDGFHAENSSRIKAVNAVSTGNKGQGYLATRYSAILAKGMSGTDNTAGFSSPVQSSVSDVGGNTHSYVDDQ